MDILSLILIAMGLAMDAFAVAIVAGITISGLHPKNALLIAAYFGLFQGGMPVLGWLLGSAFAAHLQEVDHLIAFLLLAVIGGKMILDSKGKCSITPKNYSCHFTLLGLALATSIDALAVGVSFSMLNVNIWQAVSIIGGITFLISFAGVYAGKYSGCLLHDYAEISGGLLLILIGFKLLLTL